MMRSFLVTISILVSSIGSGLGAPAVSLMEGLVLYLPFDGNTEDRSEYLHHATPVGGYVYVEHGIKSGALRITGDQSLFYSGGGHISLPLLNDVIDDEFTFSLWVQHEEIGDHPVHEEAYINFGSLNLGRAAISYNRIRDAVVFMLDTGVGESREEEVSVGAYNSYSARWKHLVMTLGQGVMEGFINGVSVLKTNFSVSPFPVNRAALGRHWWDSGASSAARMSVTLDEVRVFNRRLDPSEVRRLYDYDRGIMSTVPRVAVAVGQVVNGFLVGISITEPGFGYTNVPSIVISDSTGTGATAVAIVENGSVVSVRVVSPGSGYSSNSTISIDPPPMPPRRAVASVEVVNGFVVGAVVTDGGFGYESPPAIVLRGGEGSGATAVLVVSQGVVVGIEITNPGSGYTSAPIAIIASPPFSPSLSVEVSRIKVSVKVVLGRMYQIESSTDMISWNAVDEPFVADAEEIVEEFSIDATGRYFRIQQIQ